MTSIARLSLLCLMCAAAALADEPISGSSDDDEITGTEHDDRILGRDGDDKLEGGAGDDLLEGGPGDDILIGGSGFDLLFGGAGSDEPRITKWLSDSPDELYFWRRSRDQHRIDVMVADASTGAVRALIPERLNTYVENQPLQLLDSGDMLWWSERDGWAHLYRYGSDGTLKNRLTELNLKLKGE